MVGIKLCLLNLGLCSIESGIVFTLFFTGIPEELGSKVCGSNEYCSGWEEFLIERVKIKKMLVAVNGGVCFYGYLRWKFRLFLHGLWSVRSVTVKVHFSVVSFYEKWTSYSKSLGVVTVYIAVVWNSDDDNTHAHGFPNTSVVLTCEWLRVGTGAHVSENFARIELLSLCYARLISWWCCRLWSRVYPPPRGYIQLEFLPGVRKLESNVGTNLHYVLMSIHNQIRVVHRSAPTLPLSEVANSIFLVVLNYVLKVQTEFFKHL
ncbi:uncharacterized protein LOC113356675 isoform X1 [Papaver somniferum]|uniref:uncharacterized protein LOC113356675 isoform X1 n=1 Tax=Papaver somniferum TaxID=3469 RepID=UPI000E6FD848|nr:uncharacterized protein LOC113356675 isoform X1 [Papaver somniferum]